MDIIERFSNPTKFDIAPYGTIYQHGEKLFIQVSKNTEVSNWLTLGDFLTECFNDSSMDPEVIEQCLLDYKPKTPAGHIEVLNSKE